MPHNVEGTYKKTWVSRWRGMMLFGIVPLVLAGLLSFPSPASASTINLNGKAPGIQSISQFPNYAMWVNTPTEFNVVPQGANNGPLPGQVVSTNTTYTNVIQPIYGQVAHQGQRLVSSGYFAPHTWWAETGYWATGQTWVNSGYFAPHTWWAETGYWATGGSWETIYGGYWGWSWPNWLDSGTCNWGCGEVWIPTVQYVWNSYSYWVSTAHWQTDYHWVDTSHWANTSYWVSTAHWQTDYHWVDTSSWQTYTYYTTGIVGYKTVQVPTVTKITDSNINVSNESLLGIWSTVKNTSNGQEIYGGFCSTPTTPLIPPTSPAFPDYSAAPWDYAAFFSNNNICNINASNLQSGQFDNWATARQSVQLILTPSWSATVTYNQVTTVGGVVTSSVPVTQVETITGAPYTGPTLPTKYLIGVPCAVQNGRSYCPGGPVGGTLNP